MNITVKKLNKQTGELTGPELKTRVGSKEYLKGNRLDFSELHAPALIVFHVKNKTGFDMWFDWEKPDDCLWVAPGEICPAVPAKNMEIRVPKQEREREILAVWDPNNQPGNFAYRLNLKCPEAPNGVAWIDPVITNSGGGGGGLNPEEGPFSSPLSVPAGIAIAGAALVGLGLVLRGVRARRH